jgi:hypothetical protein
MNDAGDYDDVGENLKVSLQKVIAAELIVNQKKQADDVPQNTRNTQRTDGANVTGIGQLVNGIVNGKDKSDDDETDLDDPGEPFLDFIGEDHKGAETRESKFETRRRPREFRVSNFSFRCVSPPVFQSS